MSAGSVKVNIKWINGKQEFKGIEMHLDDAPALFKSQIFALTNVLPERQKIMYKGKQLGDSWAKFPTNQMKDGVLLTLMGSSEELSQLPSTPVIFEEDLSAHELRQLKPSALPSGLTNAGTNTCYFNSTVQMLAAIPELRRALIAYASKQGGGDPFLIRLGQLMATLEKRMPVEITLLMCWTELRKSFPQFDEKTEGGGWAQHDAEECLSSVMYSADVKLDALPEGLGASAVQQLFAVTLATSTRCLTDPSEPASSGVEQLLKMKCHIDAKTSFLMEGLRATLTEQFEKSSPVSGAHSLYESSKRITRLPKYLLVHFIRFLWKRQADTKAKILRPVDFPDNLDVFELCTPEYQERLAYKRQIDDANSEIRSGLAKGQDVSQLGKGAQHSGEPPISDPYECDSGLYELYAVITHQGRTADSGHYVCWTRHPENNNWVLFDDENVSEQLAPQIRKLVGHGGADWHIAYLTLYRAKEIAPIEINNSETLKDD